MKMKILVLVLVVIIIVLVAYIFTRLVTFKSVKSITRTPGAVESATVEYSPPPHPQFPIPTKEQRENLKAMMKKTVEKVTDGVYLANNYGFGNMIMVETAQGLVIVDTTEKAKYAKKVMSEFRKLSNKPVKAIIYTHGHVDHIFGTPAIQQSDTQIIATNNTVEFLKREQGWMKPFLNRCRKVQSGRMYPEYAMSLPMNAGYEGHEGETFVPPTVTFDNEYSFKQDGMEFILYETGGEAPGHLIVWIPEKKTVISGDLFYRSFPNVSTPMLKARSAENWIQGLEKILSLEPEYLAPCHGLSVMGKEEIQTRVGNYKDGTKYVYDETIKAINDGKTVAQAVREIKLPDKYASIRDLQQYYGRVDWTIRGIYQQYTGWYDGWGTSLNPLPQGFLAREIVKMSGGTNKILERAIEAQQKGEHQLAVELSDIVIQANPNEKVAHVIKSYSLDYLGYLGQNLNMFGFYRSAAAMERQKADFKP